MITPAALAAELGIGWPPVPRLRGIVGDRLLPLDASELTDEQANAIRHDVLVESPKRAAAHRERERGARNRNNRFD